MFSLSLRCSGAGAALRLSRSTDFVRCYGSSETDRSKPIRPSGHVRSKYGCWHRQSERLETVRLDADCRQRQRFDHRAFAPSFARHARVHLWSPFARPFDQNFNRLTNQFQIVLFGDRILDSQQFVVAPDLCFSRNVIRQVFPGLGSRPNTVLENEAVFESTTFHQAYGLLEVILGFTAEADDEIAADRRFWKDAFDPRNISR